MLKIQLCDGTDYSSTGVEKFIQPLLDEFQSDYPEVPLLLRGDSGFTKPELVVKFYCKRGTMENYIKESKNGFDFAAVSSSSKIVNANRLQVHALAYNIFNWLKRLVLPANMRKQLVIPYV